MLLNVLMVNNYKFCVSQIVRALFLIDGAKVQQ